MKVKCERCGNEFVYEKQEGVCNQCQYYMRTPIPAPKTERALRKAERPSRKRILTKAPGNQSVICVLLGILVIVVPFILYTKTEADVETLKEQKYVGQIQPDVYEIGEEVPLLDHMVKITAVEEMTQWQENIPAGFALVAINYEFDEALEDEKARELNVCLKIPDGEYVSPLFSSFLCDEIAVEYSEFHDEYGSVDVMDGETGTLMYLLPQDVDFASLVIYHMPWENRMNLLKSAVRVELEWEK